MRAERVGTAMTGSRVVRFVLRSLAAGTKNHESEHLRYAVDQNASVTKISGLAPVTQKSLSNISAE